LNEAEQEKKAAKDRAKAQAEKDGNKSGMEEKRNIPEAKTNFVRDAGWISPPKALYTFTKE
jgi:hypothetical protein